MLNTFAYLFSIQRKVPFSINNLEITLSINVYIHRNIRKQDNDK